MKKVIGIVLSIGILIAVSVIPAMALTVSVEPTERFFVNDFADVIDESAENAMYAAGVQLYQKTDAQVVVVTLDTIDGADIQEYGVQLGRAWGIGDKEKDNGILLILAVEEREVGISVGYGLEGAVTDMQSGIILDQYAIPYFQENDFSTGLFAAYDALINEVYLEYGLEADPNYTPVEELESESIGSTITIILFLLFICAISLSSRRTRRFFPGIFFFPSGGGFYRGGGTGGGFGGFRGGGGSFGGGGASRRF